LAQIGNSVGLTIGAVLAASVSGGSKGHSESAVADAEGSVIGQEEWQLLKGFRATFWLCFAALSMVAILSGGGLRKAGKVGLKKE
jgi:hypothetical protein